MGVVEPNKLDTIYNTVKSSIKAQEKGVITLAGKGMSQVLEVTKTTYALETEKKDSTVINKLATELIKQKESKNKDYGKLAIAISNNSVLRHLPFKTIVELKTAGKQMLGITMSKWEIFKTYVSSAIVWCGLGQRLADRIDSTTSREEMQAAVRDAQLPPEKKDIAENIIGSSTTSDLVNLVNKQQTSPSSETIPPVAPPETKPTEPTTAPAAQQQASASTATSSSAGVVTLPDTKTAATPMDGLLTKDEIDIARGMATQIFKGRGDKVAINDEGQKLFLTFNTQPRKKVAYMLACLDDLMTREKEEFKSRANLLLTEIDEAFQQEEKFTSDDVAYLKRKLEAYGKVWGQDLLAKSSIMASTKSKP